MIPVPWAITPIRHRPPTANPVALGFLPPGGTSARKYCAFASRLRFAGVGLVAVLCVILAADFLPAAAPPAEDPGRELERLSRALRGDPSVENYLRLSRFAGRCAESELCAQADFALGMADFERTRWPQARARFQAATAGTLLRDYATLYLVRAEAQQGALEAAQRTLEEFSFAGSPVEEAARITKADLLLRAARAGEAVRWLEAQPDAEKRPALLLALARALEATGQKVAAAEILNRIYYEFPLSPEAEPSNERLAQLRKQLNTRFPAPSEALRRKRAETLWAAHAYRGARSAYLDLSVRATEPTRSDARLRAALVLYQAGATRAACRELQHVRTVASELHAEYSAYLVRCRLQEGNVEAASSNLSFMAAAYRETNWYEEALLAAANAAFARGDTDRARRYYQELLGDFPAGEDAAEAHWKMAWLTYREGDTATAARLLEEHLGRFPNSSFRSRAFYWRAQLARAAGEEPLALRLLALLADWAPRDYWAQQAARRGRPGAPAGDAYAYPAWVDTIAQPPPRSVASELPPAQRALAEKAATLERLGFAELANETLEVALAQGPHPQLSLLQARVALGEQKYARATELLARAYPGYWRSSLEELPREAWEILFPRPYWEMIEREARREGIDPYLVAALIRQESRFERDAESSAGALGLMQVMPGTARRLARRRRLPQSRILEPEFNIQLGTRYLAQLLRRFDGSLEKAVAGYNAGDQRVEGWASERTYHEPAELVESIPVTQTREFVYTVLRNYRFYKDLYARP